MIQPHPPLLPFHVALADAARPLPANALARVHFGLEVVPGADPRDIAVPLATIAPAHSRLAEVWLSDLPVASGRDGALGYAENGEVLLGSLRLPDTAADGPALEQLGYAAYVQIEDFIRSRGYVHLLRGWNFFGNINDPAGGDGSKDAERYRQFSLGRHRALARRPDFEDTLPAGTAIGTHDGAGASELLIYFLAAKTGGQRVENPRQVSAFRYPRQYGPRSPSFSRAMLARGQLLVSGTASIVGHESRHAGDVRRQLDETHQNLVSLLQHAAQEHGLHAPSARPQALKVYLRQRQHWPLIESQLNQLFGHAPHLVLHGDICRADLDIEVEGVWRLPASGSA